MPIKFVHRAATVIQTIPVSWTCNVCGGEEPANDWGRQPEDMHVITLSGGYNSNFPGDMSTIQLVLHDRCLEAWVDTFKIPVIEMGRNDPVSETAYDADTMAVLNIAQWGYALPDGAEDPPQEFLDGELPGDDQLPKPGVYRHFKGNLYEVQGHCHSGEAPYQALVIYRALYGEPQTFVRPAVAWAEHVSRDGYEGPRFVQVT